jgi:hypothetical protein
MISLFATKHYGNDSMICTSGGDFRTRNTALKTSNIDLAKQQLFQVLMNSGNSLSVRTH